MTLVIRTAEDLQAGRMAAYKAALAHSIDAHVEARAQALGYSSAVHLAGYATSTVASWRAEAQAFVAWRDQVWQAAIDRLDQADPAAPPSAEAVLAKLPDWPA